MAWEAPRRERLPGERWRFVHGPIDLVIGASGAAGPVQAALDRAWARFGDILPALVAELPLLRTDLADPATQRIAGPVAARMAQACRPYRERDGLFITAMAAVAGAVADDIVRDFDADGVRRAYVNNGGDIALHLSAGESFTVGIVPRTDEARVEGRFVVDAAMPVRGIATSGWRGRSQSLGIADAVTILAADGAQADAAATIVANAVDCESPAIVRRPANQVRDDSDLGDRRVTVAVGALDEARVAAALDRGLRCASVLLAERRIVAAALSLAGRWRFAGTPPAIQEPR